MSLIKCPECGKDISDTAPSCPHCGFQLNIKKETVNNIPITESKQKPKKRGLGCLIAIIIFAMFSVFIGFVAINSEPMKEASRGFDKTAAGKFDEDVWGVLLQVVKAHNGLVDAMNVYTAGNTTELDFYNYCKEVSKYADKAYDAFPSNKNKDAKEYVDACKNYTLYLKKTADSLITYVDAKDTGNLSIVQENLNNTQQAATIAVQSRGAFLTAFDYSQEEVEKLANEASAAIEETAAQK